MKVFILNLAVIYNTNCWWYVSTRAITRNQETKQNPIQTRNFVSLGPRILFQIVSFWCQKETGRPPADSWKHAACRRPTQSVYAPLTKQKTNHTPCISFLETFSLPFPFCHVVYQDKVRNEVINAKTVATVPFRSLISFHHHTGSYVYDDNQVRSFYPEVKQAQYSWLGGQLKQSIGECLFQMLSRRSLAATPSTITIQDCLQGLHRWMLLSPYSRGKEKENLLKDAKYRFLHLSAHCYKQILGWATLYL